MIDRTEIEAIAGQLGTREAQIMRDHLMSHVLAAVASGPDRDSVTFFGGTALCRTWLPGLRLSEDMDLLIDSSEEIHWQSSRRARTAGPSVRVRGPARLVSDGDHDHRGYP